MMSLIILNKIQSVIATCTEQADFSCLILLDSNCIFDSVQSVRSFAFKF